MRGEELGSGGGGGGVCVGGDSLHTNAHPYLVTSTRDASTLTVALAKGSACPPGNFLGNKIIIIKIFRTVRVRVRIRVRV